ncbi:MAG: M48 family peptidase [Methanobacteriota archaeon]|nr:MAG: M48 family peptidase [Euryarchaeota archaeon]
MKDIPVKVIRSPRRRKTVSARMSNGELLIYLPARMSRREEREWVERMKKRMAAKRGRAPRTDESLMKRAEELNKKYFEGKLKIGSISFSDRQRRWHGSCSTLTGDIRISSRLKEMPHWVLDYVIVHELAHLIHGGHSKEFWRLVNRYPYAERARGFLIARDMEDWDGA